MKFATLSTVLALMIATLTACTSHALESTESSASAETPSSTSTERNSGSMQIEAPPILEPVEFNVERTIRVLAEAYGGEDEELALARAEAFTRYMSRLLIAGATTARRENISETLFELHFQTEDGRSFVIDVDSDGYGIWDPVARERLLIFDWLNDFGYRPPGPLPDGDW